MGEQPAKGEAPAPHPGVNAKDGSGRSPLDIAVIYNKPESVAALLELKADIEAVNPNGFAPARRPPHASIPAARHSVSCIRSPTLRHIPRPMLTSRHRCFVVHRVKLHGVAPRRSLGAYRVCFIVTRG